MHLVLESVQPGRESAQNETSGFLESIYSRLHPVVGWDCSADLE
jgi:hypothetical protein